MLLQRHFLNHAAQRVDARLEEIRIDGEHFAVGGGRGNALAAGTAPVGTLSAAGAGRAQTAFLPSAGAGDRRHRLRWRVFSAMPGTERRQTWRKMTNRIQTLVHRGLSALGLNSVTETHRRRPRRLQQTCHHAAARGHIRLGARVALGEPAGISALPRSAPYSAIASAVYSEQLGKSGGGGRAWAECRTGTPDQAERDVTAGALFADIPQSRAHLCGAFRRSAWPRACFRMS